MWGHVQCAMPIVTPLVLPITLYLIHVTLACTGRSLSVLVLELACLCCFSQSYPSLTETPHEALIAKLQKAEASKSSHQAVWVSGGFSISQRVREKSVMLTTPVVLGTSIECM